MSKHCTRCDIHYEEHEGSHCPRCQARLSVVLEAGDRVGPFELLEKLPEGDGGMAKVYRAKWAGTDRVVALKVAPDRPYEFEALKSEAAMLSRLDHPNIVRIFPLPAKQGEDEVYVGKEYLAGEPHAYIALEYIDGPSLRHRMQARNPLKLHGIVDIIRQTGQALSYAHHHNVLHLDIKPSNILLGRNNRVVVTDFGIATPADPRQQHPSGHTAGTARYMSPEHATRANVDYRSDIFSLGVVLYEMLTNKVPFYGQTTRRTLSAVVNDTPPPPSEVNPKLPKVLDEVVGKALAKDKRERYRSTQEFVEALEGAAGHRIRWRFVVAGVAAALLLVVLGVLGLNGATPANVAATATEGRGGAEAESVTPRPVDSPTSMPTVAVPTHTPAPVVPIASSPTKRPPATSTLAPSPTQAVTETPAVEEESTPATATVTGDVSSIKLLKPANGAHVSGLVTFRWTWPGSLGRRETFDLPVCKGRDCRPERGITNTHEAQWNWCPEKGSGVYRWQVLVIDGQSKQPKGPRSEIREFVWEGGDGACKRDTGGESQPPVPPTSTSGGSPYPPPP